jgi:DNA-binding transcriptional LysR family regulator
MLDDLEGLRALVAVADQGGFSAAGRALRLSTNAVSHRIARLEATLGARLFERTTRMVRTTAAGERLLVRARRVLDELELAAREASAGALGGTVRVALPPDLAGATVMAALARVMAASPGLRLELLGRSGATDPRREAIDLVVWGGPLARVPPDLTARAIGELAWSLCAAPAYVARHGLPAAPGDLARHRCLLAHHRAPERTWRLVGPHDREVEVAVTGSLESDHAQVLLEALRQGLGIGIRPAAEVEAAAARGDWVQVLPGWGFRPIPIALVATRGRLRVPAVRRVADALAATLRQLVEATPSSHAV